MTSTQGPLSGISVLSCRQTGRGQNTIEAIHAAGGIVVQLPLVEVAEPPDGGAELRRALSDLSNYDWLACTSVNGVEALEGTELPVGLRLAAVGPATAEAFVEVLGRSALVVPGAPTAKDMAAAFPSRTGRVLAPLAELASDDLADGLRQRGYDVDVVTAYATTTPAHGAESLDAAAATDVVIVSSPSVAERLESLLGERCPPKAVAFGPRSAAAASRAGFEVTESTPIDVVDAIVSSLTGNAK